MIAVISYPPIPIFEAGPFNLSLHGLFAAVGFVAGGWLATRLLERRGYDAAKYQSVLTWAIVGALLGARYLTAPAAILNGVPLSMALHPLHGSFSIMGGFAGGIAGGLWRMRQLGMPMLPVLDSSAFGLALGTVVGRIGDLAIVEHLGKATTVPWAYGIKPGYDVAPQHDALECSTATAGVDGLCGSYHAVAAYDLIGAGILFGVLLLAVRRLPLRYGQAFSIWVAWYGIQRFLLDGLRFGNGDATLGAMTWNQVTGLTAGLVGVGLVWWFGRTRPKVSVEEDQNRSTVLVGAT